MEPVVNENLKKKKKRKRKEDHSILKKRNEYVE